MDIVVDIPSSELAGFRTRSELPEFSPGIPGDWIESYWRDTDFDEAALRANATDTRHVEVVDSSIYVKKIAILGVNKPQSRIYIMLMC